MNMLNMLFKVGYGNLLWVVYSEWFILGGSVLWVVVYCEWWFIVEWWFCVGGGLLWLVLFHCKFGVVI